MNNSAEDIKYLRTSSIERILPQQADLRREQENKKKKNKKYFILTHMFIRKTFTPSLMSFSIKSSDAGPSVAIIFGKTGVSIMIRFFLCSPTTWTRRTVL